MCLGLPLCQHGGWTHTHVLRRLFVALLFLVFYAKLIILQSMKKDIAFARRPVEGLEFAAWKFFLTLELSTFGHEWKQSLRASQARSFLCPPTCCFFVFLLYFILLFLFVSCTKDKQIRYYNTYLTIFT